MSQPIDKHSAILITGGGGLLGHVLTTWLRDSGYSRVTAARSADCDLMEKQETFDFFARHKPDVVFHLAARVHGIGGNMAYKGEAYYQNTLINTHVVEASRISGVKKIVAMGTGAVYPYPSPSLPLKEDDVFAGRPHGSENAYAQAKRAMLAQLEAYAESYGMDYVYVISGNLYGEHDKFDTLYGHVVPSLIKKFSDAVDTNGEVSVWGNGSARRDFMYSADAAHALGLMMEKAQGPINMGSGEVSSIKDVVTALSKISGVTNISWDASKPNGQDFRQYDLSRLNALPFRPKYDLHKGLENTFNWYRANKQTARL